MDISNIRAKQAYILNNIMTTVPKQHMKIPVLILAVNNKLHKHTVSFYTTIRLLYLDTYKIKEYQASDLTASDYTISPLALDSEYIKTLLILYG